MKVCIPLLRLVAGRYHEQSSVTRTFLLALSSFTLKKKGKNPFGNQNSIPGSGELCYIQVPGTRYTIFTTGPVLVLQYNRYQVL